MPHVPRSILDQSLPQFFASPKERSVVESICIRPKSGIHQGLERVMLTVEDGVVGDRWKTGSWLRLPDGEPDPRVQVSLCSPRLLALLHSSGNPRLTIGDNLVADLDISEANLPVGQRLRVGSAIIAVSDVENDACGKFAQRFGVDALTWIRDPKNRHLRLRGLFAQVVQRGEIWVNAPIVKV